MEVTLNNAVRDTAAMRGWVTELLFSMTGRKRGPYKKSGRKPLKASRRRQGSSAEDDS
jgi:hypothetical protein